MWHACSIRVITCIDSLNAGRTACLLQNKYPILQVEWVTCIVPMTVQTVECLAPFPEKCSKKCTNFHKKMLKETETEKTVGVVSIFLSLRVF